MTDANTTAGITRKIIHIDMDAFYASVEQRDQPEYKDKPLIVGGQPDSRGVVAACSYEARAFGVHSAMPCSRAYKLCPSAIFVTPRFEAYKACSEHIQSIFKRYSHQVEPLSLDEAFLDVTRTAKITGSATRIAEAIRRDIKEELQLNASAGVSFNKFLAKIASDLHKPNGIAIIRPEQAQSFIEELPVRSFFGVGKATAEKMHQLGIYHGNDLKQHSDAQLTEWFGKSGHFYYNICRAIDERPVRSNRVRKSIGKETTFSYDSTSMIEACDILGDIAQKIIELLEHKNTYAFTLTLKVKYANFESITRSYTAKKPITTVENVIEITQRLLTKTEVGDRAIRLLGLSTSSFMSREEHAKTMMQLPLWSHSKNTLIKVE